jgi:hypothetical protein
MARQQHVGERTQPDQSAAHRLVRHIEGGDAAGHGEVRHVWPGGIEKRRKICHRRQDSHVSAPLP